MASNSFGQIFRITTWGESHGKGVGVVIDGCPAGLELNEAMINEALALRMPGRNDLVSPRKEPDIAEIYSGIFNGKTSGAPISIVIKNRDADPSKYEPIKNLLRPGHANYTYIEKYGDFDYKGGGRSSARETACRVAAGAVAKQLLNHFGIKLTAYLKQVGSVKGHTIAGLDDEIDKTIKSSPIFCSDATTEASMMDAITTARDSGDSLGGVVEFYVQDCPIGLGDPVYEKLEANLAKAMLSMPASKGFEIGEGFGAVTMQGSEHNDEFNSESGDTTLSSNHAGGTLGGISNGQPVVGRVAFKPTSSIKKTQQTVDLSGKSAEFKLPEGSRHDPCVAIRAVPVVEAMTLLVLADALLLNRSAKL